MKHSHWQFSTRNLLLLTAVISVVLAFAVKMPELFQITLLVAAPVLAMMGIFHSANFATSDTRPRLAVLSWLFLASFFMLFCAGILASSTWGLSTEDTLWRIIILGVMTTCGAVSAYRAYRSFRRIRYQPISQRDDSTNSANLVE